MSSLPNSKTFTVQNIPHVNGLSHLTCHTSQCFVPWTFWNLPGPLSNATEQSQSLSMMCKIRQEFANFPGIAQHSTCEVLGVSTGRLNINTYTYNSKNLKKRKLKRKRKQKRKRGSLREGREAPPRRCPHLFRFCFRFRFNFRFFKFLFLYVYVLIFNRPVVLPASSHGRIQARGGGPRKLGRWKPTEEEF